MSKVAGEKAVLERLEEYAETEKGPVGEALDFLKQQTGQPKFHIYLGALVMAVTAVAASGPQTASTIAILIITPYPVIQSLCVAEVGRGEDQATWLLYWCLYAIIATLPVPLIRVLLALWLQHPVTNGIGLIYRHLARPFVLLQHRKLHMGAFAKLHPAVFNLCGLSATEVQPFLVSGTPGRLEPKVKAAIGDLGVREPLEVAGPDATALTPDPNPASFFTNPNAYSAIASAALTGIRNAAAAKA